MQAKFQVRFKVRDTNGNYYGEPFREFEQAEEHARVMADKLKRDMLIERVELIKCVCPRRDW